MDALEPASIAAELLRESTFHGRTTFTKPALLRKLHFKADGIPKTIVCGESDIDTDKSAAVRRFRMESFSNLVVSLTRSQRAFQKFDESELCECTSKPKAERFPRGIRSTSSDTTSNLSSSPIPRIQHNPRQQRHCCSESHRGIEPSDPIHDHLQCHGPHTSRQPSVTVWSRRSERNLQPIGACGLDASIAGNDFTRTSCMPHQGQLCKSVTPTTQRKHASSIQPLHVVKHPMNEHAPSNRSCQVAYTGRQPTQRIPLEPEGNEVQSSENLGEELRGENFPLMALSHSHTPIQASSSDSGPQAQMYGNATTSRRFVGNERERSLNGNLAKCGRSKMSRRVQCSFSTRNCDVSESKSNFKVTAADVEYKRFYNERDQIHKLVACSTTTLLRPMEEKLLVKAAGKGQARTNYVAKYMDSLFAPNGPEVYQ
ncbi:hypothetical protein MHU86_154 [Fragilaria crotonensis]|nr:hypothetical protein MHU86_154 [Fragilaria crotonensis]